MKVFNFFFLHRFGFRRIHIAQSNTCGILKGTRLAPVQKPVQSFPKVLGPLYLLKSEIYRNPLESLEVEIEKAKQGAAQRDDVTSEPLSGIFPFPHTRREHRGTPPTDDTCPTPLPVCVGWLTSIIARMFPTHARCRRNPQSTIYRRKNNSRIAT